MAEQTSRYIPNRTPCGRSRREFLWQVGGGFAGLGLIDLLSRDGFFERQARGEGERRRTGAVPARAQAAALPGEGQARASSCS